MEKQFLQAGQIVSTHGVQGEVKILPWADAPEFLLDFDTFYLNGKPYEVVSSRVHKTCVLAKLRNTYRYHIVVKAPLGDDLSAPLVRLFRTRKVNPTVNAAVDIDPVDLL